MDHEARQVFEAALALSREERADLAAKLLASVHAEQRGADSDSDMHGEYDPDPEVEKAWAEEVVRRVERIERGEAEGVPGEEVEARMLARFGTVKIPGADVDAEARRIIKGER